MLMPPSWQGALRQTRPTAPETGTRKTPRIPLAPGLPLSPCLTLSSGTHPWELQEEDVNLDGGIGDMSHAAVRNLACEVRHLGVHRLQITVDCLCKTCWGSRPEREPGENQVVASTPTR